MVKYETLCDGKPLYYDILDDGFKIYVGQTDRASIHQYEPYIPDPSKSYEENAIQMCKDLCENANNMVPSIEDRVTNIEANIDYLMLLNDPDSATEDTAN